MVKVSTRKKTVQTFTNPKVIYPVTVRAAILPIYNDFTKGGNAMKCLHGITQNARESFNGMI